MPTSVRGPSNHRPQAGFSLLEMLVVMAIIGIVTGTVSLSVRAAGDTRKLHDDARRLALLFPMAQAQARSSGQPVIWEYDDTGYRFTQAPRILLLPATLAQRIAPTGSSGFDDAGPLRPRSWTAARPVAVRVHPPQTNVFRGEWVSGPLAVELHDGLHTVWLQRTGSGSYQVQP